MIKIAGVQRYRNTYTIALELPYTERVHIFGTERQYPKIETIVLILN